MKPPRKSPAAPPPVTGRLTSGDKREEDVFDTSLRPQVLAEFVGQAQARSNLSVFIEAARQRGDALDHVLFVGQRIQRLEGGNLHRPQSAMGGLAVELAEQVGERGRRFRLGSSSETLEVKHDCCLPGVWCIVLHVSDGLGRRPGGRNGGLSLIENAGNAFFGPHLMPWSSPLNG